MKRLLLLVASTMLLAALAYPQSGTVTPSTVSDVTGTGATVQLVPAGGNARWVQLVALSANGAAMRCGGSAVTVSRGAAIAAGGGFFFPPISGDVQRQPMYSLGSIYCYIANGDKVSVLWGN